MMDLAPFLVAIAIGFIHVLSEKFSEHIERFHIELLSFGAGLMVGIFFLEILPHITIGEKYLNHQIYLTLLFGFIFVHILEKTFYKHASGKREFEKDVALFKAIGLCAYGLLLGIIITIFFGTYGDLAYFIIIPFFIRAIAISVSSKHINEKLGSDLNRILQFAYPVIGAFIGFLLITSKQLLFIVFSITMGFVLYIIIRDIIPPGREGKPTYFIAGALITIITFLLT